MKNFPKSILIIEKFASNIIKNKIINLVVKKDEQLFFTIKGGAGTGKTLLVYDIARELTEKGEKVLVPETAEEEVVEIVTEEVVEEGGEANE